MFDIYLSATLIFGGVLLTLFANTASIGRLPSVFRRLGDILASFVASTHLVASILPIIDFFLWQSALRSVFESGDIDYSGKPLTR
jgi:hypothetical protein